MKSSAGWAKRHTLQNDVEPLALHVSTVSMQTVTKTVAQLMQSNTLGQNRLVS